MNYMTNGFVPVVRKWILDIILPIRTSSFHEFILVESLGLFFNPTSSLRKSILVESLVYFLNLLHPCFASLFQSSLLFIFRVYHILASRGLSYVSQLKQIPFMSLFQASCTKPDPDCQADRERVTFTPLPNSCWFNKVLVVKNCTVVLFCCQYSVLAKVLSNVSTYLSF